jgi:acetylornithine/succinyldiaminopimelate/putrescine aminotransferase
MLQRPLIKTVLPGPKAKQIIEDTDSNTFMDCNAGIAVCSTGHCHPEIIEANTNIDSQVWNKLLLSSNARIG